MLHAGNVLSSFYRHLYKLTVEVGKTAIAVSGLDYAYIMQVGTTPATNISIAACPYSAADTDPALQTKPWCALFKMCSGSFWIAVEV